MEQASIGVLAAVFVALTACAGQSPPDCRGTYHLHASVTAEQRSLVEAAFAKWRAFVGRDVVHLVEAGNAEDATCSVRVDETNGDLGLYRHEDASISFAPDLMRASAPGCAEHLDDCIEATVLHETGHALGLAHTPASAGPAVMSADGEFVLDFTPADRAECERVGLCAVELK